MKDEIDAPLVSCPRCELLRLVTTPKRFIMKPSKRCFDEKSVVCCHSCR